MDNGSRPCLWCGGGVKAADDEFIPDYYAEPGLAGQRQYSQDVPQEFIDPFSGKLHFSFADIHLPGNAGLDITVRRNYLSLDETSLSNSTPSSHLGLGWQDIHLGRVLRKVGSDMCSTGYADKPILELPDGQRQIFHQIDSKTPLGYSGYLFVTKARWVAKCVGSKLQVWSPEGLHYYFDACGSYGTGYACYAVKIEDRHGQRLDLSYNGITSPYIASVQATDGRRMDFSYTIVNNFPRLTQITGGGQTWRYTYANSAAYPNIPSPGIFFLRYVDPPEGNRWEFSYHDKLIHSSNKGALSLARIENPSGGTISYDYDWVAFDLSGGIKFSTVITEKRLAGTDVTPGTWRYAYQPGSSYDTTTVTGPTRTEIYKHFGYSAAPAAGGNATNGVWKIGLLLEKAVGSQQESYSWSGQLISDIKDGGYTERPKYDPDTYAPLLIQKTIRRDGTDYTTNYGSFDNYGNPGALNRPLA